jgi:hypothetical protein
MRQHLICRKKKTGNLRQVIPAGYIPGLFLVDAFIRRMPHEMDSVLRKANEVLVRDQDTQI